MRKISALILLTTASAILAGCGSTGLLNRNRPDEFAVQRQPPLLIPPDFALVPPQPGAPRAAERNAQQQTLEALFGGQSARSSVETVAGNRAGTPASGIRSSVGDSDTNTVNKGMLTRDILAAPQGDGRASRSSAGSN